MMRIRSFSLSLAVLILAAACAAPPDERPYRDAALDAARWLRAVEEPAERGVVWPVAPGFADTVTTDLYHGTSGVVLFFVELARATGDESYLDDARRGADHLLATLPTALEPWQAGLYNGAPGAAYALYRVAEVTGEERYREGTTRVVELLRAHARPEGDGVVWNELTDVVSGAAGTGLFLLWAGDALDDPAAVALAAAAGQALLDRADVTEHGLDWAMTEDSERRMPNFSHGTAGVAYFLASLYRETDEQAFLDAALAGGRHLLAVADVGDGSYCRIHHHEPGGEELYYLSWCHGPAGTARLFYQLYRVTGDEEWLTWLDRAAVALETSGIPEQRTPGFWNNVGQCCGSAGVASFLLAVDRVRNDDRHLPLVRRLADDVLARADRDEPGLKWIQAEHRVEPDYLMAQTGLMQGAAGVGRFLLDLDAALNGGEPPAPLPDSPF